MLSLSIIEEEDGRIAVRSPYHPNFPARARSLGGIWNAARRIWVFDSADHDRVSALCREIYGADDIIGDQKTRDRFKELQEQGYGHFPVCIAKTQYSLTTDPDKKGAPKHHVVPIREVRLSAGAEFIVAICGDIMTMPGLPRIPSANKIDVTQDGRIVGLF